jgi:hypothetical protein
MDRAIVTWRNVPEFPNVGANTCQVSLFNDGRVQLDYVSVADTALTTGIGPGDPSASVSIFDFSVEAPITAASGIIAEAFAASRVVDIARVGQRFYQTHADDYDFLVMFTNFSSDLGGAFAFELNLRNSIQGIGLGPINFGADFGSPGKLSSFVHMNDLTLHDEDSQNLVLGDNTSLAVIGHEVGHRWLAFPQIAGAAGLTADDLLGRALAHWSFYMNSNASFDEGNLWSETSPNVFTSVDTVSRYSPLDQYLMGLRAIGEVPPFFVINNSTTPGFQAAFPPTKGAVIDGARVEVTVQNIIAAEGDRVPGFPVTQREFTGAFILVTLAGQGPTGSELARLESLRSQFTPFFNEATNRRATFDSITHPENAVGGDAWRVYAGKDAGGPPPPR